MKDSGKKSNLPGLLFVVCALFLAFILLSVVVANRELTIFDLNITVTLQRLMPRNLDSFLSIFSILGTVEVTTTLLILLLLVVKSAHRVWKLFLYGVGLGIEVIGKTYLRHPSPPSIFFRYNLNFFFPSAYVKTDYSYPSGHIFRTVFLLTILEIIILSSSRIKNVGKIVLETIMVIFLFVMMVSRIYLGEHWTSDVVAGLLLGLGLGLLSLQNFDR